MMISRGPYLSATVLYFPSKDDLPDWLVTCGPCVAIVVRVLPGGRVKLRVLHDRIDAGLGWDLPLISNVKHGRDPGCWDWPSREDM